MVEDGDGSTHEPDHEAEQEQADTGQHPAMGEEGSQFFLHGVIPRGGGSGPARQGDG